MAQERSVILHGQEIPSLCLVGEFELLLVELNAGQADTRGGVFRGVAGTALLLPCARPPIFSPVLERPDVLRMTPRWRSSRRSCTRKPRSPSPTLLGSVPTRRSARRCLSASTSTGRGSATSSGETGFAAAPTTASSLTDPAGAVAGFSRAFVAAAIDAVLLAVVAFVKMPSTHVTGGDVNLHMH